MFLQMLRRALVLDLSTAFGKLMVPTRRNRRVDGGKDNVEFTAQKKPMH